MENPRFNMQGYLVELDRKSHRWTWNKWEYAEGFGKKKRVVRRRGFLEFMKMLPSLFNPNSTEAPIHTQEEMESTLKKNGVDFIFLYQDDILEEHRFKTVEEAEGFHKLETYPLWDLTDYWFAYDWNLRSWAMYDAFTGELEFTPRSAEERLQHSSAAKAARIDSHSQPLTQPARSTFSYH